jgi:hypothetical protein
MRVRPLGMIKTRGVGVLVDSTCLMTFVFAFKPSDDRSGQKFVYFVVAWNGLRFLRFGIHVPVVVPAVPYEDAAHIGQDLN